jgi:hypothetical protein
MSANILTLSQSQENNFIIVEGGGFRTFFQSDELATSNCHPALWFGLPVAMATGKLLHIDGIVHIDAIKKANDLSKKWSTLLPDIFDFVTVTASRTTEKYSSDSKPALMTFSGGVDSTYALLSRETTSIEQLNILTILGMDIRLNDESKFQDLVKKIQPNLISKVRRQIKIRNDAGTTYRALNIPIEYAFGFQLAACLSCFSNTHSKALIAADTAHFLECVSGPYGTSSALTPLFSTPGFSFELVGSEATRPEKLVWLCSQQDAMKSVVVCKNYSTRPQNCGVCVKCVRTKAQIIAELGYVPEGIFLKTEFTLDDLDIIDLRKKIYSSSWNRILEAAERNGHGEIFKGYRLALQKRKRQTTLRIFIYKAKMILRARKLRRKYTLDKNSRKL